MKFKLESVKFPPRGGRNAGTARKPAHKRGFAEAVDRIKYRRKK